MDRAQEVVTTWRQDVCLPDESSSGSSHGLQATIRRAHPDSVWFAYINGSGPEYSWVDHVEVNGVAVTSDPFYSYSPPPPALPTAWDSNPNYIEGTSPGMSQRVTLHVKYTDDLFTTVHDATLDLCGGTPWNEYILYGHEDPHAGASSEQTSAGFAELTTPQAFQGVAAAMLLPTGPMGPLH